ncbi:MAG: ABC transporter permease subunit [Clostridiales bacterium]|nr:ABC transporter permease subunit [Clostridiales bacterium]
MSGGRMEKQPSDKNWFVRALERTMYALKRVWTWIKRAFTGKRTDGIALETPSKALREAFFRKKTAVTALILFLALFAFVFISPLFIPMDVNYTDALQQNVAPVYTLRRVPKSLKTDVAKIDGFSGFTVGLSNTGEVFVWGSTKDKLLKIDYKAIPKEVQEEGAIDVSAGKDHILAVTKGGKIVGWGDDSCGQYGFAEKLNVLAMPNELKNGVAVEELSQLVCGYQSSALVKKEGKAYVWGNLNATPNLAQLNNLENVQKIVFTNSVAVALLKDGRIFTGTETPFTSFVSSKTGEGNFLSQYLETKKVVEITATNKCIALLLSDGELLVSGVFENGEEYLPALKEGEYFLSIDGGSRHFVGVTNEQNAYAWGHNAYKQCAVSGSKADKAFAGALQSYLVKGEEVVKSVGLRGYIMGTDGRGRDVFTRIVHGGKMTLTVGGVAVLISAFIGILIGCISGYFGGAVDVVLMRITEIFSAIPFLPFAMLLSQIIKYYNVSEGMRIFIIMLILGVLSWTGLARMVRGQVLAEREKEFVTAARAIGVKERRIAFRHVLPNIISVILVSMTLDFAGCLLTESSLSYLGFGVQQPHPTWGNMLNGSNSSIVIQNYWWQWLFPALFLSLAVICINVVGDALRDALDPKRKR